MTLATVSALPPERLSLVHAVDDQVLLVGDRAELGNRGGQVEATPFRGMVAGSGCSASRRSPLNARVLRPRLTYWFRSGVPGRVRGLAGIGQSEPRQVSRPRANRAPATHRDLAIASPVLHPHVLTTAPAVPIAVQPIARVVPLVVNPGPGHTLVSVIRGAPSGPRGSAGSDAVVVTGQLRREGLQRGRHTLPKPRLGHRRVPRRGQP